MASKKPVMEASQIQRKEYAYSIGATQLKFTLRTDVKIEMKAWLELMERAREDVTEDLNKLK